MTDFVNPYTFVPLAGELERRAPAGHAVMGDGRVSGSLRVTLTARTPLLIGGYERKDAGGESIPDVPRRVDGSPMVPGSGLLGAVRSVHEALAGGCLRVLDCDWVAVHRHPASTMETSPVHLGVVLEVDAQGRATKVGLCDQVVWIDQRILPRDEGRVPRTGDRLIVPVKKAVRSGNRDVLRPQDVDPGDVKWRSDMAAALDDSWALLVTDTHARTPGKPVYFAAGRVGPGIQCHVVGDYAWALYRRAVAGAARVPERTEPVRGSRDSEYVDVFWPLPQDDAPAESRVGRRLEARTYLHKGQPVWVATSGPDVTELRLSQLWRYEGGYSVGERAGAAGPCSDPDHLCWSCRVFGSADTSGRGDDEVALQRSYRGHVRADDLVASAPFEPVGWHLAPLASPKPSAGQFYLDNTAVARDKRLAGKEGRPAATWGSVADDDGPRPIRGRKFYWRTHDPETGPHPRGQYRGQADTQTDHVALIPAKTVFTGRVTFENLSAEDYGSLLAALDPRLLAAAGLGGWEKTVTSVGGGKPFGFGAVSIDVTVEWARTADGRYLGKQEQAPGPVEAVAAFHARVPRQVAATWPALQHVLELGFVQDDLVWYPPGSAGGKGDPSFDRSFEFFGRTNGLALKDKVRDLVALPAADAAAGKQVMDSQDGEHPREPGERPSVRGSDWERPGGGRA